MKRVDYSKIAPTYDELAIRVNVPPDPLLIELSGRIGRPVRVLDVGCGTGSYLLAQSTALGARVALFGVDPSEAMLARAREKLPGARLEVASAESIPHADGSFDFVATRFAFHHFEDKPCALREMCRVLAPGGTLFMTNIAPERMPGWWVFSLFPEAAADNFRYWPAERIVDELVAIGFETEWEAPVQKARIPLAAALAQAETRDQSHLYMMDDAAFGSRLEKLCARAAAEPEADIPTEVAVLKLVARLPRA